RPLITDPFLPPNLKIDKGTGLGLSVSHGIIEDHGGNIWLENNSGGGTNFVISLPLLGKKF
ncbi:ATP-binding protein, partial [Nitrospinota bacterium]